MTFRLSEINTTITQTRTAGNRGIFEGGHVLGQLQSDGFDSIDQTGANTTSGTSDTSEIISIATPADAVRWTDLRVPSAVLGSACSDGTYGLVHSGVTNLWLGGSVSTYSHWEWVSIATGARSQNYNQAMPYVGHQSGSDGARFVYIGGTQNLWNFSENENTVRFFSVAAPAVQSYAFGMSFADSGGTEPVLSDGQRFRHLHTSAVQDIPSVVTNGITLFPASRQWELVFSTTGSYMAVAVAEIFTGNRWNQNPNQQLGGAATDGSRIITHSFEAFNTVLNLKMYYNSFDCRAPVQQFGTIAPGSEYHVNNHYPTTTMTTDSSRVVIQYSRGIAERFGNGHLESVNTSTPATAQEFGNPISVDRRRALGYSGG